LSGPLFKVARPIPFHQAWGESWATATVGLPEVSFTAAELDSGCLMAVTWSKIFFVIACWMRPPWRSRIMKCLGIFRRADELAAIPHEVLHVKGLSVCKMFVTRSWRHPSPSDHRMLARDHHQQTFAHRSGESWMAPPSVIRSGPSTGE